MEKLLLSIDDNRRVSVLITPPTAKLQSLFQRADGDESSFHIVEHVCCQWRLRRQRRTLTSPAESIGEIREGKTSWILLSPLRARFSRKLITESRKHFAVGKIDAEIALGLRRQLNMATAPIGR